MNANAREFHHQAELLTADIDHRNRVRKALGSYEVARDGQKSRYRDWSAARTSAGSIKYEAVHNLDKLLVEFTEKLEARGTKVFWASTAKQACEYIEKVAADNQVRSIIKSKSMTSEEIHLNHHLEEKGYHVVESDLGEFIVQLRNEAPYHLVFPAMHLTRGQISDLFKEKLGTEPTDSPEELTMIARRELRQQFLQADMGITGANFGIAETGMVSITENEGNSRLTAALPRVQLTLLGIEKILPKLDDLALFLPMLATAGAGQLVTGYNTLYGGPKQEGEIDGPEEFHVVLLDNSRTTLLADAEQRDALHCIRCGACLNVCPIFKNIGGHSYGTVYQGPIGSVITPHLRGLPEWKHLAFASSLCGACSDVCPVHIDLHHHLLHNRRNSCALNPNFLEKLAMKGFALMMRTPFLYYTGAKIGSFFQKFHGLVNGSILDPLRLWTKTREFPKIPGKTFKDLWNEKKRGAK